MKKLLGIIVLGLLLSGNAYAEILPNTTPNEQYEFATKFLKKGNYEKAEIALKEFVDKNSKHRLAGSAQYWIAETFRIRQRYTDAAIAYLDGYKKYPKSESAPINFLKFGKVLVIIGERDQGCAMIKNVEKQYPKAHQSVIKKSEYEYNKYCIKKQKRNKLWTDYSLAINFDIKQIPNPEEAKKKNN